MLRTNDNERSVESLCEVRPLVQVVVMIRGHYAINNEVRSGSLEVIVPINDFLAKMKDWGLPSGSTYDSL